MNSLLGKATIIVVSLVTAGVAVNVAAVVWQNFFRTPSPALEAAMAIACVLGVAAFASALVIHSLRIGRGPRPDGLVAMRVARIIWRGGKKLVRRK